MSIWLQSVDDDPPRDDGRPGAHAVLSGKVRYRRNVVDRAGHPTSVTVLEIGCRGGHEEESGASASAGGQEGYLTMLLLTGEGASWGDSRPLACDEERPQTGMTLVVDGTTRVCDLVRYAYGVLEKGGEEQGRAARTT